MKFTVISCFLALVSAAGAIFVGVDAQRFGDQHQAESTLAPRDHSKEPSKSLIPPRSFKLTMVFSAQTLLAHPRKHCVATASWSQPARVPRSCFVH
ncbi:hypothetical protein B0H10DRAFT_656246 [Mycena sp. CBHHK59/15]|nr:hypothetical protein B0H10DRAFT_656246 [Mycena sp. CBHHK59/15]